MIINDRYKIVSTDDLNITLQRRNKKPDGTWSIHTNIGYYSNFNDALKSMIKKEILATELQDFKTICNKIDELNELVKNLELK